MKYPRAGRPDVCHCRKDPVAHGCRASRRKPYHSLGVGYDRHHATHGVNARRRKVYRTTQRCQPKRTDKNCCATGKKKYCENGAIKPALKKSSRQAAFFSNPSTSYPMAISFLGLTLASSFFGISTVSTPFLCVALIFPVSTYEGRLKVRLNSL